MKIEKGLALITGGSSGMGLEFARQLAEAGCDLVLVSIQEKELEEAREELSSKYGVKVVTRYQNLALANAADELFEWCNASGLLIDILVSNAGMFFFEELCPENMGKVEAMTNLHIATPTRLCILFGNEMKKRRKGSIISMASMAARLPVPGIAIYSASKAYLKSFGKSMYFELRPYGVSFTTVCPAAIATPLYRLKKSLMDFGVKIGLIKTPHWLVRKALRGMKRRRATVQPGLMNIYLPPMIRLLPAVVETRIWKKFNRTV